MITETRERFIRAIAEHVEPGRIVEAYFFPSIRQGPMETGVAVLAATPRVPAAVPLDEPLELPLPEDPDAAPPDPRTEVLTASYRWTRKGADRGKWEVEVKPEADAPLTTVERVVRGVQERAGEALDAHRMNADEIRALFPDVARAAVAAEPETTADSDAALPASAAPSPEASAA